MKRILSPDEIPLEVREMGRVWQEKKRFDPAAYAVEMHRIFRAIPQVDEADWRGQPSLRSILARHPKDGKGFFAKSELIAGYRHLVEEGDLDPDPLIMERIRMKPVRTASGVAPVTVLTAPAGCPGKCIFCPDDYRMPKSYIYDEPGCQRAERDGFDPFKQTYGRIHAFESIGHDAKKVELLILGGTWSAYSQDYREWFVRRCFDAMNAYANPDFTPAQSLDDEILAANKRGHDVASVRHALGLLRTAGFKLHLHWMPNLYGATPEKDRADFARFFSDPAIRPDELKIYPCSLIAGTELYERYLAGEYEPYAQETLVHLLADLKPTVPPYTRINRLFRDIPAHHILAGVTAGNLREVVHEELARRGTHCGCIRCHEVRRQEVREADLRLRVHTYETDLTTEHFLCFTVPNQAIPATSKQLATHHLPRELIAGFLRLSLPKTPDGGSRAFLDEIRGSAMIREVHVYGPALAIGKEEVGAAQHVGLGTRLIDEARRISRASGFNRLSVIAATGTRGYYADRGFAEGELYMGCAV
jgi:elongator complex protein 3